MTLHDGAPARPRSRLAGRLQRTAEIRRSMTLDLMAFDDGEPGGETQAALPFCRLPSCRRSRGVEGEGGGRIGGEDAPAGAERRPRIGRQEARRSAKIYRHQASISGDALVSSSTPA